MTPFYENRNNLLFVGPICDHPFSSHVHDVVEIVCLTKGWLSMTIAGMTQTLSEGDIAVAFPSIAHSYDALSPDAEGLAIIFQPDTYPEYVGIFRSMRPAVPYLKSENAGSELAETVWKLISLSKENQSGLTNAYLHVFLAYFLGKLSLQALDKYMESGLTHQVLKYISEHFSQPLTLDSTAHALGISRSHLSHIFSQQLHINFRQYINKLRIDRACFLLRDPQFSITQIGFMCGYENSRTFHRAFQNERGMQPGQYRANELNDISSKS